MGRFHLGQWGIQLKINMSRFHLSQWGIQLKINITSMGNPTLDYHEQDHIRNINF